MSGERPTVYIVDDDASIRTSLTRLLRAKGYEVYTYGSAADFLARDADGRRGCVVLDLHMPGLSGLQLQEALAHDPAPLPIVFLTGHGDVRTSVRAMKSGAVDFLSKPVEQQELFAAVERALTLDLQAQQTRDQQRQRQSRLATLTQREQQVFALVVAGKLNKQIARELGITERTVKAHRAEVMRKLGAESLAELVQLADRLGVTAHDEQPPL